jgi:hypothetical protein
VSSAASAMGPAASAMEATARTAGETAAAGVEAATAESASGTAAEAPSAEPTAVNRAAETAATYAMCVSTERGRATASCMARTIARSEMMVTAAAVTIAVPDVWSSERKAWGVEPPPERIVENSVARDKCISGKPGIPVPSIAIPAARSPATSARVRPSRIDISVRQIRGPQASPPIEVVHVGFLVEFPRL